MRSSIRIILLPALALTFAACGDEAVSDGGGTTTGGVQDSGMPDSGGGCTPACASPLVCDTATNQCTCPSGAPPCGTACCANNFTCATNPFQCVCNLTYCGSDCINTINDPLNCGGCGKVCDGGVTCSNYACNYPIPDSGPAPDSGPPNTDAGPPKPDGGLPGLGTACNPNANPSPCFTNFGLFCSQVALPDGGVSSTCQLPPELQLCQQNVGCEVATPPLFCSAGFQDRSGNMVNVCVNHCTTTANCPDRLTNCIQGPTAQNICFLNLCGPGSAPPNGTVYYAACDAEGTGDGVCLPFLRTTTTLIGFCAQTGTVADWQPCAFPPDRGAADGLCTATSDCTPFFPAAGGQITLCTPQCAPTGALSSGPACISGQTCFANGQGEDWGFCLQDCLADGTGPTCPPPTECSALNAGSAGVVQECLPPLPDAG